jgi:hypothetical protein
MLKRKSAKPLIVSLLAITLIAPRLLWAAGFEEGAGNAVGMTVGNSVFVPAKAAAVGTGVVAGIFSFIVTFGNVEVTKQIWQNTFEGPYLITPAVAQAGVGERPELERE